MGKKSRKRQRPRQISIPVSSTVTAVPMERIETYFNEEIVNEGRWRSGVPLTVLRPEPETFKDPVEWFGRMLEDMKEVRARFGPKLIPLRDGGAADIGLIDVIVNFKGPVAPVLQLFRQDPMRSFDENTLHLEWVFSGAFHDQMVLATAIHFHRPSGKIELHYHNLIFGIRKEIRGDRELLGTLDVKPLLDSIYERKDIGYVYGIAS